MIWAMKTDKQAIACGGVGNCKTPSDDPPVMIMVLRTVSLLFFCWS